MTLTAGTSITFTESDSTDNPIISSYGNFAITAPHTTFNLHRSTEYYGFLESLTGSVTLSNPLSIVRGDPSLFMCIKTATSIICHKEIEIGGGTANDALELYLHADRFNIEYRL